MKYRHITIPASFKKDGNMAFARTFLAAQIKEERRVVRLAYAGESDLKWRVIRSVNAAAHQIWMTLMRFEVKADPVDMLEPPLPDAEYVGNREDTRIDDERDAGADEYICQHEETERTGYTRTCLDCGVVWDGTEEEVLSI